MAARYELREVVGAGGCAHVVRARRLIDGPDGPDIALKVMRPELVQDAAVARRFRDEAHILGQLRHPNVVRMHELLSYEGRLVMELEYVAGATLDNALGQLGPAPVAVALAIVRQVADVLVAAWDTPGTDGRPMHIVHRDLKPANLALSVEGRLRLLDFGYAKGDFEGRAAQSLHDVWGSIGYDAPERKRGLTSQKADVYALGVVLFVSLTTRAMLLSMKVEHHDVDLEALLESYDPPEGWDAADLVGLVRDCMCFDPEDRLSLEALIERVDALIPPDRAREALASWCRTEIRDLWNDRFRVAPDQDRDFAQLAFLENDAPTPESGPMLPDEAGRRITALLATEGWTERTGEFDAILDSAPQVSPQPFLDVLDRLEVPFWKFWVRASTPAEVEAALLLLLRLDPDLAGERAKALLEHQDERLRKAARFTVGG